MSEENQQRSTPGADIKFEDLIAALLNSEAPLAHRYLYRLTDLEGEELKTFTAAWPQIEVERRKAVLKDVGELADLNTLLSFESVCKTALTDEDPIVRKLAIQGLSECEDIGLIDTFLNILDQDPDDNAQAQAASGLGHFIYLGELGKLSKDKIKPIVEKLLAVMKSQAAPIIRRKALESLGYSSHPRVPELIEENYDFGDEDWLASVLVAMGRTADEQWEPYVVDKLSHSDNLVRLEAVRAAGELVISEAAPYLIELLNDEDRDIRMAAAWSLSEIGGTDAEDAIEAVLEQTEDEEEIDHLESALENLAFNEELVDFEIFDFSEDELEDDPPENPEEE